MTSTLHRESIEIRRESIQLYAEYFCSSNSFHQNLTKPDENCGLIFPLVIVMFVNDYLLVLNPVSWPDEDLCHQWWLCGGRGQEVVIWIVTEMQGLLWLDVHLLARFSPTAHLAANGHLVVTLGRKRNWPLYLTSLTA